MHKIVERLSEPSQETGKVMTKRDKLITATIKEDLGDVALNLYQKPCPIILESLADLIRRAEHKGYMSGTAVFWAEGRQVAKVSMHTVAALVKYGFLVDPEGSQ